MDMTVLAAAASMMLAANGRSSGTTGRGPAATVAGHLVTRRGHPMLRISVPSEATYAGRDHFTLYGVADCELHVFVDADSKRHVRRLYWLQFEQYLPIEPESRYTYGEHDKRMTLWGRPTWIASGVGRTDRLTREGSDREHVNALLKQAGYVVPPIMIQVRMVRLLDDPEDTGYGRRELMLIYAEDLALSGESYEALGGDGDGTARRKAIEPSLLERAAAAFQVTAR